MPRDRHAAAALRSRVLLRDGAGGADSEEAGLMDGARRLAGEAAAEAPWATASTARWAASFAREAMCRTPRPSPSAPLRMTRSPVSVLRARCATVAPVASAAAPRSSGFRPAVSTRAPVRSTAPSAAPAMDHPVRRAAPDIRDPAS